MSNSKPNSDVFIVCSKTFLERVWQPATQIAKAFRRKTLSDGSNVRFNVWDSWFKLRSGAETFAILDLAAKTHEWAVVVFAMDDLQRKTKEMLNEATPINENVLFELGLFYGHVGAERVFILEEVAASGPRVRVPGDVHGIQRLRFTDDPESFADALRDVLQAMKERSEKPYPRWAPASSLAIGYVTNVIAPFVRSCEESRTKKGLDREFTVEVLLPTNDFRGTNVDAVRLIFEGAGCREVSATGERRREFIRRPVLWSNNKALPSDLKQPACPAVYYDIPTTLITAERVITRYLDGRSATTTRDSRDLTSQQANAFSTYILGSLDSAVRRHVSIKPFSDTESIRQYLEM
jgi:predicted nucleotide-binding protein